MSLRGRFTLYLSAVYLLLALFCFRFFADADRSVFYLVLAEAALIVLAWFGYRLVRDIFGPIEVLYDSVDLLREGEFTTRIKPAKQEELDQLIEIYNKMSERLRQEQIHNQQQEAFLEKIMRATPSGVLVFNFDSVITDVNPAAERLLEQTASEILGKRIEQVNTPLASALADLTVGSSRILSLRGRRKIKCARAHFLDRGFYKTFISMDELTGELYRTEKQAYGKLIRIMSHEVNNSIGAANSLLHSLLHYQDQIQESDREDFRTAIEVVISRTEHLKTFTSEYADVVRLPRPDLRQTDVLSLIDQLALLLRSDLEKRAIEWRTQIAAPLPKIAMDPYQMEQVLLNIVKNAIEAIGNDGVITIRADIQERRPMIAIEDTGVGVSTEVADVLFTPFFTTKSKGQGIGLTMVQEILNNHGFDFALENGEVGARFTIWFTPSAK